jgi:hypothetical protein
VAGVLTASLAEAAERLAREQAERLERLERHQAERLAAVERATRRARWRRYTVVHGSAGRTH